MKYNIKIYNWGKCLIFDNDYIVENETEAVKQMLDEVTIADGDSIFIEEVN